MYVTIKAHANGRNIVGQQHPTMLGVVGTCFVLLHGPLGFNILPIILLSSNNATSTGQKYVSFLDSTEALHKLADAYSKMNEDEKATEVKSLTLKR